MSQGTNSSKRKRVRTKKAGNGEGVPNDATEYYVSGEGMWINNYLRGRFDMGELTDSEMEYLKDLDKATSGNIKEKILYRNVDAVAIFGNISENDYEAVYNLLRYGENAFDKGAYSQGQLKKAQGIVSGLEGTTKTEKGFMSTTTNEELAENWGDFTGSSRPIVMQIETGRKTKGVDLSVYDRAPQVGVRSFGEIHPYGDQYERLLKRGQRYSINKIGVKDGMNRVYVKMKD